MSFESPEYFYRRLHKGNPGDVEFYERVCQAAPAVLELGCGWGRILNALSRASGEVWGVDVNEVFVDEARRSISSANQILVGDITRLSELQLPLGHFDRVVLPYNTVYGLGGVSGLELCLKGARRLLAPNGELWFDVYPMDGYQGCIGQEELPEDDDEPVATWETDQGPVRVLESSTIDHEAQHLEVTYSALDDAGKEVARSCITHDYLLLPQIEEVLEKADFKLHLVAGGFDGLPYDEDAEQLIIGASA